MSDELPAGWIECSLADVLLEGPTNGWSPKSGPDADGPLTLKLSATTGGRFVADATTTKRIYDSVSSDSNLWLRSDDILIQRANTLEYVGTAARYAGPSATYIYPDLMMRIRVGNSADPRYITYWLSHDRVRRYFRDNATGTAGNMPKISGGVVKAAPLVLAPLPEQKRIADKLDALLARADACRERLDRVPGILKRFRQSVLAAATSGELTREWREERGGTADTNSWVSTRLAELCLGSRVVTYGVIKLGEETPGGIPCLRTSNVRWLRIDTDGMKRIAPSLSEEFGRTVLQGGEVLVNVRGTLGGVAVVESTMRGWNVSREVAVVPVDQKRVNSHFLAFWVGSDHRQRWLSKVEKGVAYTGVNIEDLRELPVSVPPMEEQIEIVRRVQALLQAAEHLERRRAAVVRAAAPLTPSVLAKAFRGELVPQEARDEPASGAPAPLGSDAGTSPVDPTAKRPRRRKAS